MVKVVGPCFSLAASGNLGEALNYFDCKYSTGVRIARRYISGWGLVFATNKEYFKLASDRAKAFNTWQRAAWKLAYPGTCDHWRDIYLGQQIYAWNMDPSNNLTWPMVSPQDVGTITFYDYWEAVDHVHWAVDKWDIRLKEKWCVSWLWWRVLDNPRAPVEADLLYEGYSIYYQFDLPAGHTSYLWGGVRYLNGTWKAFFLKSYVR